MILRMLFLIAVLCGISAAALQHAIPEQPLFNQPPEETQNAEDASAADTPAKPLQFFDPQTTGIELTSVINNEIWNIVSGGIQNGTEHLFNAELMVSADLQTLTGLPDAHLIVHFLGNNGGSINRFVGDMQMVSNIEGYRVVKLYQCLLQKEFTSFRTSVLLGLYDLNSEFYVTPTSGLFLNGSHGIGIDMGQSGRNGPSIFPNTALALRVQWTPLRDLSIAAAVIDGYPGRPDDCNAFDLSVRPSDGVLFVTETDYLPDGGTKFGFGLWYYTGSYADICGEGGVENYFERNDNAGMYVLADKTVFNETGSDQEGLALFTRFGIANAHVNSIGFHFGAGIMYTGLIEGREEDQAGYAIAVASVGEDFRVLNQYMGNPIASFEAAHEITYRTVLIPQLAVQFDLQYIIHPSASLNIDNVLAGGIRAEVSL